MKSSLENLKSQKRGFTLVEMIISMAASSLVIAMAALSFTNLYKLYFIEQGYRNIHDDARKSVALIDRDVRRALTLTNMTGAQLPANVSQDFSTNFLCIYIPATVSGDEAANIVLYKTVPVTVPGYSSPVGVLYRYVYTNTATAPIQSYQVTRNPVNIDFSFYKDPGQKATSALVNDTYEVRTFLIISNQVLKTISTDRIQVRTKIRNKNLFL